MWRAGAKFAFSAVLLWVLFRRQDLGSLSSQIMLVDRQALAVAIAITAGLAFLVTARWAVVLDAMREPTRFWVLLPIVWIGLFFNQFLPSAIGGDAMRIWLAHKAGLSVATSLSSTLAERLSGIVALLLLGSAAAAAILGRGISGPIPVAVLLILAGGYAGFAVSLAFDWVPERFLRYRLLGAAAQFAKVLRAVLLSRRFSPRILAFSVLNQLGTVVTVYALAKGLAVPVDFFGCLAVVPIVGLLLVAPFSIAGWGLREGAFVAGFGMVGVVAHDALALSVLYGLVVMLPALGGGLVWLAYRNSAPAPLPSAAQQFSAD